MQAAAAGLGIALLPYSLCVAEIEAGRLVGVLAEYRQEMASVYAAFPNRRQIARAVSVFVDFVSEKLRRMARHGDSNRSLWSAPTSC